MNHLAIAGIVFACVFGSALLGLYLRAIVPRHHLGDDSISVVKLTTGLIATMAALVLGLLISSAKSSFDAVNGELVRNVLAAANGWQVAELRTEEGRLDEVFRRITLPETVTEKTK